MIFAAHAVVKRSFSREGAEATSWEEHRLPQRRVPHKGLVVAQWLRLFSLLCGNLQGKRSNIALISAVLPPNSPVFCAVSRHFSAAPSLQFPGHGSGKYQDRNRQLSGAEQGRIRTVSGMPIACSAGAAPRAGNCRKVASAGTGWKPPPSYPLVRITSGQHWAPLCQGHSCRQQVRETFPTIPTRTKVMPAIH